MSHLAFLHSKLPAHDREVSDTLGVNSNFFDIPDFSQEDQMSPTEISVFLIKPLFLKILGEIVFHLNFL